MKIFVKAKTYSRRPGVNKISDNVYEVAVSVPPIKGLANKAITKALAAHFNVAQSQVRLVAGYTSKQKIFDVTK